MDFAGDSPLEIERIARTVEGVFRARTASSAQAIHETARLIRGHLQTWRDSLCQQLQKQLEALAVGCPPSFIRVAGQNHLEKPFNRLLAWLADPNGDHGCGVAFLKGLAQRVEFPELVEDLEQIASGSGGPPLIRVEEPLDGDDSGKEPDLAIRTPRAALLLENKVWAPESGDQYAPYLAAFRSWAGPDRRARAYLCARSPRDTPPGWNDFLLHRHLADILLEMSRRSTRLPVWGRICAEMCAAALTEASDHEKVRLAWRVLDETKASAVTVDQIRRLQELSPLPEPIAPWKEISHD